MIVRPAMVSSIIALVVEVPLCLFLSLWGIKGFAYYLSSSTSVAQIAQTMWKASCSTSSNLLVLAKSAKDYRLVLHFLCSQLPALCHSASYHPSLVSLSSAGLQSPLGTTMGYHCHANKSHGGRRVEVPFNYLWWVTGL